MKEKLRITIVDINDTIIQKDFDAYEFYEKPFIELAQKYNLEIKETTSMVSKKVKQEIIMLEKDLELKFMLKSSLKQSYNFNPVEYQKIFTAIEKYDFTSYKEIQFWLSLYKEIISFSKKIIFERIQVKQKINKKN